MNSKESVDSKQEYVPRVHEPHPICSLCHEPISAIIEAIQEPDGSFSHFDCVIDKIKKQYNVKENEVVSYIGHGCFAVVAKDEEGKFVFRDRIQYESTQTFDEMKKFVEGTKA